MSVIHGNAGFRSLLAKVFRALALLIVATLIALTVASYFQSTPGTGDILLTIVLAVVTVLAGAHLMSLDRRYHRPADPRDVLDVRQSLEANIGRMVGEALAGKVQVNWDIGSPEVHRMDRDTLAKARVMASEGRLMDEICSMVDGNYANWSPPHQEAFRNLIQAAIDQG